MASLTVYLLNVSNLRCVDRHLGYMKKLRSKPLPSSPFTTATDVCVLPVPGGPWMRLTRLVSAASSALRCDGFSERVMGSTEQGLTLVHFSAQPELLLTQNTPQTAPVPP